VDPEIAKIRKKHAEAVKEYLRRRASEKLLKTLMSKTLHRLVPSDLDKLYDWLQQNNPPIPAPAVEEVCANPPDLNPLAGRSFWDSATNPTPGLAERGFAVEERDGSTGPTPDEA
jgi:hypothetical protein